MDEKRLKEIENTFDVVLRNNDPAARLFYELIAEVRRLGELVSVTAPLRLLADLEANRAQDIRDARRAERERILRTIEGVAGTAPAVLSLDKAGNETFGHGWNSALADASAVIHALPDEP